MGRGPFMDEMLLSSPKDVHMLMMELPRLLDRLIDRYGARSDSLVADTRDRDGPGEPGD